MKFMYEAYGMTASSEIELPELRAVSQIVGHPDISVALGNTPRGGLAGGKQISPYIWVGENDFLLEVPRIARFRVIDGRKIIIDAYPNIDADSIRVFLLGSALGALLFQRNLLVLHGSAVEIGDKCLICVGNSGVGKSTLTAAFMQRGYRVLADDVVPVTDDGFAIPGFPRIKLWQDVADKLEIETTSLKRIRPTLQKYNLPLGPAFCDEPRKIAHIFVLSPRHEDGVAMTTITGMEKFPILRANTYRERFMSGMSLQPTHLRQCGALASQAKVSCVARPKDGFHIDALVDRLLSEMQELD